MASSITSDRVASGSADAWAQVRAQARAAIAFSSALAAATQRKRLIRKSGPEAGLEPLRVALIGGGTLSPLRDLLELFLWVDGFAPQLFVGEYDNYVAEILGPDSPLVAFEPQVTIVIPSEKRCRFVGSLDSPLEDQRRQVTAVVDELVELCEQAHQRTKGDVVITSFVLPSHHDIGSFRTRSLTNEYTFRKAVNLELGLRAPATTLVCDLEFLAARTGGHSARDPRHWFESKQLFSLDFAVAAAREMAMTVRTARRSTKKVLVLDLDNTLWGGVIGDDGVDGIELGDTSPRGEAFKAFQTYVRSLKERGVLLAVCSKNDYERAIEPFQRHPEMVLKLDDFVSFKANWEPKSDNLREMATELSLGIDSFVFVDDNPAEIAIVNQFTPEVAAIALGSDPSSFVGLLADSRHFEPRAITKEDRVRLEQYQREAQRQAFRATVTDMASYLSSLEMRARLLSFRPDDVQRIAQLINKSNQFNLTTKRRTEAEVVALMSSPAHECITVRLADRFGDHGLIAIAVLTITGAVAEIDTWLMSCRVLKRQVEEITLNEIFRRAASRGANKVVGRYLGTAKNGMVRDLYPRFGFELVEETPASSVYQRLVSDHQPHETKIIVSNE